MGASITRRIDRPLRTARFSARDDGRWTVIELHKNGHAGIRRRGRRWGSAGPLPADAVEHQSRHVARWDRQRVGAFIPRALRTPRFKMRCQTSASSSTFNSPWRTNTFNQFAPQIVGTSLTLAVAIETARLADKHRYAHEDLQISYAAQSSPKTSRLRRTYSPFWHTGAVQPPTTGSSFVAKRTIPRIERNALRKGRNSAYRDRTRRSSDSCV